MAKSVKLKDEEGYVYPFPYYPVGSIYLSVLNTNPSTLFGGTWEQIKDVFLLGCGNIYSNGNTGGKATHTLTTNEMPSHYHRQIGNTAGTGNNYVGITMKYMSGVNTANTTTPDACEYTGGGQPHNNMPPYLAVYMWRRTE